MPGFPIPEAECVGSGASGVASLVPGDNIGIDNTDPDNPVVSLISSPALAGNPTTPTPAPGDNDNSIANTAFVVQAIAAAVAGLLDLRGGYDASTNLFPSAGGSGTAGAVLKGDTWIVSVAGTLGADPVTPGDVLFAEIDTPGQVAANWTIIEHDLAYAPENAANKSNDTALTADSATLYPTQHAVKDYADAKVAQTILNGVTASAPSQDQVFAGLFFKAPLASPTGTGTATWPAFSASGLTGATAASRYVGATTSGAPTTGTFAKGDFVIDQTGIVWICTVAGSPGSWVDASSSGHELAYAEGVAMQLTISTITDVSGLSISFDVGSRPVIVEGFLPDINVVTAASTAMLSIRDSGGTYKSTGRTGFDLATTTRQMRVTERIATPGSYTRKLSLEKTAGSGTLGINASNDATTFGHISAIVV